MPTQEDQPLCALGHGIVRDVLQRDELLATEGPVYVSMRRVRDKTIPSM
jgi:hypothetical protein